MLDKSGKLATTYVDQEPSRDYLEWGNNRQKAEVSVLKKEKDTDRVLGERCNVALSAKRTLPIKTGMWF